MTDREELDKHVTFLQHMLKATGRGEFLEVMLYMQNLYKTREELREVLRAPPKVDLSQFVRAEAERVADLVSGKSRGSKSPWSL